MSEFRSLNQTLAAKVEAPSGTEAVPAVATDAIKAIGIQFSPTFDILDTDDEHTGGVDAGDPIVGGGSIGMSFGVTMRGSGAGGTPPEYDPLLRACGLAAVVTAADVTGTAQAGAASSITLAAGASATDDAYKGMPIFITAGAGVGESAVITAYDGATKVATVARAWAVQPDATSDYSIPANVLYRPASSGLETATVYAWQHSSAGGQSLLRKLIGAAGNMELEIVNRQIGRLNFQFTGKLPAKPANVAHPGAAAFDDVQASPFIAAEALLGGAAVKFNRFTVTLGNTVAQADDPAAEFGLDLAAITRRKITGTINPNLASLATRNNFADFLDQVPRSLVLRWGSAAGRRVSLLVPAARYTGAAPTDTQGVAAEEIPFQATGTDSGIYLCVH